KSDTETHGGVRMNIDRDYVDAATAAPGGRLSGPPESFWLYTAYGNVYTSSGAAFYGSPSARSAHETSITGMTATRDGRGYWLVPSSGTVFDGGDATNREMAPALPHTAAAVGIVATPTGGYWLFTRYGNVYTSSGASWYGSPAAHHAHEQSITGMTATPDRGG